MILYFDLEKEIKKDLYKKIIKIVKIFYTNNYECYLVGGWIRDILLKKQINTQDIDIATNAKPEEVMKMFPKVIPTGIKHGTVTILFLDLKIECTTYRIEFKYSDFRRPEKIEYAKSIYEDLSRRDFTINAFAYDPIKKILIDEYNGLEDLKKNIIRCIGNPKDRFLEDGLRPIRACRFQSTLGFTIEENTKKAILDSEVKKVIQSISIERFTEELWKGFKSNFTSLMLKGLYELEIINLFINQKVRELPLLFYYYLDCFSYPEFKFALWFWYSNFHIEETCKKLKLSKKMCSYINFIIYFINFYIENSPYRIFENFDQLEQKKEFKEYRRILSFLKKNFNEPQELLNFLKEFIIHTIFDHQIKKINQDQNLKYFFGLLNDSLKKDPLVSKDLSLNGEDLLKLGFKGIEIGKIQEYLLEFVLENPINNQKQILLEKIEMYKKIKV